MHIDRTTLTYAHLALNSAVRDYLFDRQRQITLIDFGHKEKGGRKLDRPAIRFHVEQKLSAYQLETACRAPLPGKIEGFDTDVVVGTYATHPDSWTRWQSWGREKDTCNTYRADSLRGGISISAESHYGAGTLGGRVLHQETGAEMILSNWHVLVHDWWARPGQRIYQPGRLDGGSRADTVATLTADAMSVHLDAAVAILTGQRRLINDQLHIGPVRGVTSAKLGMKVTKTGRTTGKTLGFVTGIAGTARVHYGYLERLIRHVVAVEPLQRFEQVSAGGDSGAWWIDLQTMRAIGLHFAGSDYPERALALDMSTVLNALNVYIA
jgi:hypothetical protein